MKLIYSAIASLDGYIEDETGAFDWGAPDEEVHTFVNDLERPIGTYLYGRRMYQTMLYWQTAPRLPTPSPALRDCTDIWQAADKVVFSKTLGAVSSARTLIERDFDPETIRSLKATAEHDLTVGGADLAGQAMAAGLVDELQLFSVPVLVGGGKRSLPRDVRADLELLDLRQFDSGVVFQRYAVNRDHGASLRSAPTPSHRGPAIRVAEQHSGLPQARRARDATRGDRNHRSWRSRLDHAPGALKGALHAHIRYATLSFPRLRGMMLDCGAGEPLGVVAMGRVGSGAGEPLGVVAMGRVGSGAREGRIVVIGLLREHLRRLFDRDSSTPNSVCKVIGNAARIGVADRYTWSNLTCDRCVNGFGMHTSLLR